MSKLLEQVAVVTGSAQGIGLAIAEFLASEGALVYLLDLRQEQVDKAIGLLSQKGLNVKGYACDVCNPQRVEEVFGIIFKEHKKIDILINNAGITKDNLIMRMKEEEWDSVINVNLKGTFNCIQKISRIMLKQKHGVIINISSVIGIIGNAGQSNYAASKGGVIALTKSAAKELASRNIRVNAIAPGFIETEMTAILPQEVKEKYYKNIPLAKMGKPEDVANLCLFLASVEAGYITGQTIALDGGLTM